MQLKRPSNRPTSMRSADRPYYEKEDKGGRGWWSDLRPDLGSVVILLVLYTLQGVPMGLSSALTMIMKDRGFSLSSIGTFTLNTWPFSLKLLWAPVVDALFIRAFGRRKSWLIPCQLLIGLIMLLVPVETYLDEKRVLPLTASFLGLYFLCATQDIAVDGWALTMLSKQNVAYASTCNSVGQTLGTMISFTGFLALDHYGLITLGSFMRWSGVIFISVTICVAVFKRERAEEPEDLREAYRRLYEISQIPHVRTLAFFLLVWKFPFAPSTVLAPLMLQEYGIPRENLAYIATILSIVAVIVPMVVAPAVNGPAPMRLALRAYPIRLSLLLPFMILITQTHPSPGLPFYAVLVVLSMAENVLMMIMFSAQMAFFARVADDSMGGTYMTLLNTIANLGNTWVATASLKVSEHLAVTVNGTTIHGFYVQAALSLILGFVFYFRYGLPTEAGLSSLPLDSWAIPTPEARP